jgi:hypothetical protein
MLNPRHLHLKMRRADVGCYLEAVGKLGRPKRPRRTQTPEG